MKLIVKSHEILKKCDDRNSSQIVSGKRFARQNFNPIETINLYIPTAAIMQRLAGCSNEFKAMGFDGAACPKIHRG